jgi:hypothetical protein
MPAKAAVSPSVGRRTSAFIGESVATSNSAPAPGSQVEAGRTALESDPVTGWAAADSPPGVRFSRAQASAATTAEVATTVAMRRNRFIQRNLERPEPASTPSWRDRYVTRRIVGNPHRP